MAKCGTKEWSTVLTKVSLAMNNEVYGTFQLTLYKIVFNQNIRTNGCILIEKQKQAMVYLAQDEQQRLIEEIEEELKNLSQVDSRYTSPFV